MVGGSVDRDTEVLAQFIKIYCDNKHEGVLKTGYGGLSALELCSECSELLSYSTRRREMCPLDPKPACKRCHIHCYMPSMREKIREVMRHSGMHLIRHGRLDLLLHYFF
jgi:hypothetical protein